MLKNLLSVFMGVLIGVSFIAAVSTFYPWSDSWLTDMVAGWTEAIGVLFERFPFDTNEPERLWAICFALFWGYIYVLLRIILSAKRSSSVTLYSENLAANAIIVVAIYFLLVFAVLLHPIAAGFMVGPYIISAKFEKIFFYTFNLVIVLTFAIDLVNKFIGW